MKLTIELVPKTAWYSNVRSNVPQSVWDIIRKKCYKLANYKCEVCGGVGEKHSVECHEIWAYDDKNKIQTLIGFISLCPTCHKVKHAGLAQLNDETDIVIDQLMKVNNISATQAEKCIDKAFDVWRERSKHKWELNISLITNYKKEV